MCSILGILDIRSDAAGLRDVALELSRRQRHRGSDWSGVFSDERAILAHERLSIVDVLHGTQPLGDFANGPVLAVNGKIYNHRELRARFPRHPFATQSDCEVIIPLYLEKGVDFLNDLNGIFAFVLYDIAAGRYLVARDPIGVVPLYTGRDAHGNLYVASEMKALTPVCRTVAEFPSGHYLDSTRGLDPVRYYHPSWQSFDSIETDGIGTAEIRKAL